MSLVSAPPNRRTESDLQDIYRRLRNLEGRLAHSGSGTTTIITGGSGSPQTGSQRSLGYIVESAVLAADGRTVLWVAQNTLTNGPPTVMATLP